LNNTYQNDRLAQGGEIIKISLFGDLMPADTTYSLGKGIGSKLSEIIDNYSDPGKFLPKYSDLVLCNLEAPILESSNFSKSPFAGNPLVIELLKILNVSVVSIANNHILDHNTEGLSQTIKALTENGISQIGHIVDDMPSVEWRYIKGKKFAFAAFNAIHDHEDEKLIAPLEEDSLFTTLEEIKKQFPDYIFFSFHWGNEYVNYPSAEQVFLAHKLIDNGVNVIIGHHSHVVQPVEKYNGGIILYSLGNFLFDMFWSEKVRNGMQVDLILYENKTPDFLIKPFRTRTDFSQDYNSGRITFSLLEKGKKALALLKTGSIEEYHKAYGKECNKSRLNARIRMKLYLFTHFFGLSPQAKSLLMRNIRAKAFGFWKNN
jgi:gamma-polyglutamate biosynthesis protein CapA